MAPNKASNYASRHRVAMRNTAVTLAVEGSVALGVMVYEAGEGNLAGAFAAIVLGAAAMAGTGVAMERHYSQNEQL